MFINKYMDSRINKNVILITAKTLDNGSSSNNYKCVLKLV